MKCAEPGEHKNEGRAGPERAWDKHMKNGVKHLEHHHREEARTVERHEPQKEGMR